MRVSLSVREGVRLFSALLPTTTDAGGARYPELIDFLRSNNAKWYEAERGIADKVGVDITTLLRRVSMGNPRMITSRPKG